MLMITIEDIKQHLNIDFDDDDEYLDTLLDAATSTVENYINRKLSEYDEVPAPIIHAIKIMIGNLYNSRESVSYSGNVAKIPYTYEYLLQPYKSYKQNTPE